MLLKNASLARQPLRLPGIFRFVGLNTRSIVLRFPMQYRAGREHRMTLLNKVFTTKTLLQIIFVLATAVIMKAVSSHYDFSWATALVAG
jgi:hypothetical protein